MGMDCCSRRIITFVWKHLVAAISTRFLICKKNLFSFQVKMTLFTYLSLLERLLQSGHQPREFFKSVEYGDGKHKTVIEKVLSKEADIGGSEDVLFRRASKLRSGEPTKGC